MAGAGRQSVLPYTSVAHLPRGAGSTTCLFLTIAALALGWLQKGTCARGDSCPYAHSVSCCSVCGVA